jgi:hypothetical protein
MNYAILLNVLLGVTVLIGFFARYVAVLTHRTDARNGRLSLIISSAIILYAGVIFASMDKVAYGSIFRSALILSLVYFILDTALAKLAKYV